MGKAWSETGLASLGPDQAWPGPGPSLGKAWFGPGLVGLDWPRLANAKHEATQHPGHSQIHRRRYFPLTTRIIK